MLYKCGGKDCVWIRTFKLLGAVGEKTIQEMQDTHKYLNLILQFQVDQVTGTRQPGCQVPGIISFAHTLILAGGLLGPGTHLPPLTL
jgi:hypothetical protein